MNEHSLWHLSISSTLWYAGASKHLWLGNLNTRLPRAVLKAVFEVHGPVDDVVTFPGRMYAFVNFQHAEDAARAQEALDGKEVSLASLRILLPSCCCCCCVCCPCLCYCCCCCCSCSLFKLGFCSFVYSCPAAAAAAAIAAAAAAIAAAAAALHTWLLLLCVQLPPSAPQPGPHPCFVHRVTGFLVSFNECHIQAPMFCIDMCTICCPANMQLRAWYLSRQMLLFCIACKSHACGHNLQ